MRVIQEVKQVAAQPNSKCGLDKTIKGTYTLGCYTAPARGQKHGRYLQLTSKTAAGIRAMCARMAFSNVTDRIK